MGTKHSTLPATQASTSHKSNVGVSKNDNYEQVDSTNESSPKKKPRKKSINKSSKSPQTDVSSDSKKENVNKRGSHTKKKPINKSSKSPQTDVSSDSKKE